MHLFSLSFGRILIFWVDLELGGCSLPGHLPSYFCAHICDRSSSNDVAMMSFWCESWTRRYRQQQKTDSFDCRGWLSRLRILKPESLDTYPLSIVEFGFYLFVYHLLFIHRYLTNKTNGIRMKKKHTHIDGWQIMCGFCWSAEK